MTLREIAEELNLEVRAGSRRLDNEVTGGYASDLLSDVLANSKEGDIWVTLQIHQNIIAVASIKGIVGIVIVSNREPEEETILKAEDEGIPILVTSLSAFEIIGRLYKSGISGADDDPEGI